MYERRISGSISSTQPVKIGRLEMAKCNMRRSESYLALHNGELHDRSDRLAVRQSLAVRHSGASRSLSVGGIDQVDPDMPACAHSACVNFVGDVLINFFF